MIEKPVYKEIIKTIEIEKYIDRPVEKIIFQEVERVVEKPVYTTEIQVIEKIIEKPIETIVMKEVKVKENLDLLFHQELRTLLVY